MTRRSKAQDQDDPPDDDGSFAFPEPEGLAVIWPRCLETIRSVGVEGRDHQVAIAAMAVARFRAMGRIPRILLVGGPGQGKSIMLRAVSQAFQREVISIAGTTLSRSGWEGLNLRTVVPPGSGRCVVAIDGIDSAVCMSPRVSGNSLDRIEHQAQDLLALADGLLTPGQPPSATCTLPRLRIGLVPTLARTPARRMHASVASLWTPIYLPPLSPVEIGSIVVSRANADAAITSGMCGYDVQWSAMALRTLQRAALTDPKGGVRLGLSLVARTIENALISAMAMGIRDHGRITISPEHVPGVEPAPPMKWDDYERGTYGVG
jgi:hypothetical protein